MKHFIATMLILISIAACSTLNLDSNATPAQKKEAHCKDAKAALALARMKLVSSFIPKDAELYWRAFAQGAEIGIATYCSDSNTTEAVPQNE